MPGFEQTEQEIRYRIRDPDQYDRCRSKDIAEGIRLIVCRKRGTDTWQAQALRFDKDKFTLVEARRWVEEHPEMKAEANSSYEDLANPESWHQAAAGARNAGPIIHFKTMPGEGDTNLKEGIEAVETRRRIISDSERLHREIKKKAIRREQKRIRKDLVPDEVKKAREEFESIKRELPMFHWSDQGKTEKQPVETVVPTFQRAKALAAWTPLTPLFPSSPIGGKRNIIEGVAVDTSVNKNNWRVKKEDLPYIAKRLIGRQIRLKHDDDPRNVVGIVIDTSIDNDRILFKGELDEGEVDLLRKVAKKYLDSVSIQLIAQEFICSVCGQPTRDKDAIRTHDPREHDPPGHEILENPDPLEISLVTQGAYDSCKITNYAG